MKKYPRAKLHNGLIRYECRNGLGVDNPKVISCLHKLDMVPLELQALIAKEGFDIIFFNGPLTDNWEQEHNKGKKPKGYSKGKIWDKIQGVYNCGMKRALIGINGDYYPSDPISLENIFLHEFGHGFDDLIGKFFCNKYISEMEEIIQAAEEEPFKAKYFNYPIEYVAKSVNYFYSNYHSRKKLRENQPTIFEILNEINDECK
jgi:Pro-Pro endopeptidase